MEHILQSNKMDHLDVHSILSELQHGFRKRHSCETQLLTALNDIALDLDHRQQVDVIIMDFQKAFDKVPHRRLLLKFRRYGIRGENPWMDWGVPNPPETKGCHRRWIFKLGKRWLKCPTRNGPRTISILVIHKWLTWGCEIYMPSVCRRLHPLFQSIRSWRC